MTQEAYIILAKLYKLTDLKKIKKHDHVFIQCFQCVQLMY
jgi:hypothetical protein